MVDLIPEYLEVHKLLFSFQHRFFNTRFGFGRVIAQISKHLHEIVEIEVFCSMEDQPHLETEFANVGLSIDSIELARPGPPESSLNSFMPVFGHMDETLHGLTFPCLPNHKDYDAVHSKCEEFARRYLEENGIGETRLPFEFGTARIATNSEIALVSNQHAENVPWLNRNLSQSCIAVPFVEQEPTKDLDVFIVPVAEHTWLLTEFPPGDPARVVTEVVKDLLRANGQDYDSLPALPPIVRDDVNCRPNYANALLVNGVAIVPSFGEASDETAEGVFRQFGYRTHAIDARQIVESNSIFHCMSKTVPKYGRTRTDTEAKDG
jgi:hypothetical protein